MRGHHAVHAFVFHHLLGIENHQSQRFSSHALQIICYIGAKTLDAFGVCKAAAAVTDPEDPEVPMVWALEIGTDWTETSPTIFVAVGKIAVVQWICSASR